MNKIIKKINYHIYFAPRIFNGWSRYFKITLTTKICQLIIKTFIKHLETLLTLSIIDLEEAFNIERKAKQRIKQYKELEKRQLWLGADKDHPDGIYAQNGNDLIKITNDEYERWYP